VGTIGLSQSDQDLITRQNALTLFKG